MIFVAIQFPPRLALAAQRAPTWSTAVVQTASGRESTDQQWSDARHDFDVSFAVRQAPDYRDIVEHFHQVRGRARSFPFKDFLDHRVEQSNGVLIADDDSPQGWLMVKRYGAGANAWYRPITRPMLTPPPAIYRTRSGATTVATADATVDFETGAVDMANHIEGDTYAWSGQFYVPCRYNVDALPSTVVNKTPGPSGELLVSCASIPVVEVKERG